MSATKRRGPKTTAEIAARERGVLRRGDNHILRDENDVPIDGYRPATWVQILELTSLAHVVGAKHIPAMPNNVAAADVIRRLQARAF